MTRYHFATLADRGIPWSRWNNLTDEDRAIFLRLIGRAQWQVALAYMATLNT